jgi:hypothetical protein
VLRSGRGTHGSQSSTPQAFHALATSSIHLSSHTIHLGCLLPKVPLFTSVQNVPSLICRIVATGFQCHLPLAPLHSSFKLGPSTGPPAGGGALIHFLRCPQKYRIAAQLRKTFVGIAKATAKPMWRDTWDVVMRPRRVPRVMALELGLVGDAFGEGGRTCRSRSRLLSPSPRDR